jgi:hypothetical protein
VQEHPPVKRQLLRLDAFDLQGRVDGEMSQCYGCALPPLDRDEQASVKNDACALSQAAPRRIPRRVNRLNIASALALSS